MHCCLDSTYFVIKIMRVHCFRNSYYLFYILQVQHLIHVGDIYNYRYFLYETKSSLDIFNFQNVG